MSKRANEQNKAENDSKNAEKQKTAEEAETGAESRRRMIHVARVCGQRCLHGLAIGEHNLRGPARKQTTNLHQACTHEEHASTQIERTNANEHTKENANVNTKENENTNENANE